MSIKVTLEPVEKYQHRKWSSIGLIASGPVECADFDKRGSLRVTADILFPEPTIPGWFESYLFYTLLFGYFTPEPMLFLITCAI